MLSQYTPKYARYSLGVALRSVTLRVSSTEQEANVNDYQHFLTRNEGSTIVDVWIPAALLESKEELFVPLAGLQVDESQKTHCAVLCRLAIGRLYLADIEYARIAPLPKGYNTFIVTTRSDPFNDVPEDFVLSVKDLYFFVKDRSRLFPLIKTFFEYDAEFERTTMRGSVCGNCGSSSVVTFCKAERAALCSKCDEELHDTLLRKRHERISLDRTRISFPECAEHSRLSEYFCTSCSVPLCTSCKMEGNHSFKQMSDHILISLVEACQNAERKVSSDSVLRLTKPLIEKQNVLLGLVGSLREEYATRENEIHEKYKLAMCALDEAMRKKMHVLRNEHTELAFRFHGLRALSAYVDYELEGSDRVPLLTEVAHYELHREKLAALCDSALVTRIEKPQFLVCGDIRVTVDEFRSNDSKESSSTSPLAPELFIDSISFLKKAK